MPVTESRVVEDEKAISCFFSPMGVACSALTLKRRRENLATMKQSMLQDGLTNLNLEEIIIEGRTFSLSSMTINFGN